LWLLGLVVCCFLIRLITAYCPVLLRLAGLIICGVLVRLIGLAYCNTLSAFDPVPTWLIPELFRLTKQFFNRLVLCLLEKPRHMITTITNPGLPAWPSKEGGSITKHQALSH
jgi:hypothetical protein